MFQYVAMVMTFQLCRTSVTIREESNVPDILQVQMIDLSTRVSQRPGAQAVRWVLLSPPHCSLCDSDLRGSSRVEAALQRWNVTGFRQQNVVPSLVSSVGDSASSLLSVVFEKNPEESAADQLLRVHSQPVEIIYDAVSTFSIVCHLKVHLKVCPSEGPLVHPQVTINSLVDFFKTDKDVDLDVLTSATLSKLEEIKEKTATGGCRFVVPRGTFSSGSGSPVDQVL